MRSRHLEDQKSSGLLGNLCGQSVTAAAHGLPGSAYTGETFWQRETEKLFPDSWVFVGFTHELTNAGDAVPVTVAGKPLLLLRNRDGEINGFHNVCRHRCLKLVDTPGNVGRLLKCPYHAWAYSLNGELRATPYFGGRNSHSAEGFDRAETGLVPVRTAIWHDWIFVNLGGDAQNFDDFIQPLVRNLEALDLNQIKLVGVIDLGIVQANWKALMENFIEPYHVQFVHKETTKQPLRDHYTVIDGPCLGSAVDLSDEDLEQYRAGKTLAVSSRYLTLFPNFVFGRYFPDQIGVHLNTPIGPGQTHQRRAIYTTDGSRPDESQTEALKKLWSDVHREDHEICERLQMGRLSDIAESGGFLSPEWENSVRRFQELVAAAVS
ncbi:aromatic ring-hydroxylating dioxygenase subunit alpha [Pelagibius sp. Alg239-R121]|uniref:aromatic ring-hydroxylating oxygenase subunit alpha n=1 Tax=Pelagibius sp. Alg239-R121 TaxID=2993448 RepID=UPI0024A6C3D4|nr:aromatic ring-hydroxylating dioxygenase subunit alpha [Pelagibius sp. Alg239-R121]